MRVLETIKLVIKDLNDSGEVVVGTEQDVELVELLDALSDKMDDAYALFSADELGQNNQFDIVVVALDGAVVQQEKTVSGVNYTLISQEAVLELLTNGNALDDVNAELVVLAGQGDIDDGLDQMLDPVIGVSLEDIYTAEGQGSVQLYGSMHGFVSPQYDSAILVDLAAAGLDSLQIDGIA